MSDLVDKFMAEQKKLRNAKILKSRESHDEWEVVCPYCCHEQEDIWEHNISPGGAECEIDCDKCEKNFIVSAQMRYSTRGLK